MELLSSTAEELKYLCARCHPHHAVHRHVRCIRRDRFSPKRIVITLETCNGVSMGHPADKSQPTVARLKNCPDSCPRNSFSRTGLVDCGLEGGEAHREFFPGVTYETK